MLASHFGSIGITVLMLDALSCPLFQSLNLVDLRVFSWHSLAFLKSVGDKCFDSNFYIVYVVPSGKCSDLTDI